MAYEMPRVGASTASVHVRPEPGAISRSSILDIDLGTATG